MEDTKKTTKEVKTFTQEEVDKMLKGQESEQREKIVSALAEKSKEAKMRETDLLVAGQDNDYSISKWEVMKKMANDMVQSGALPKSDNAFTVMMKMQAGREMGLKPIESIKAFYIVNGVLSIFGDAVIRRLREHGFRISYEEKPNECKATITKNDETYSETFTFEEAKKSGWTDSFGKLKPGWIEGINRKRKLRYGAISTLIKTYVPEVLGSAADIAEVAEDTVPLYKQKGVVGGEITNEIGEEVVEKLNNAKTLEELIEICKVEKTKIKPEFQKSLVAHYTRRKNELEGEKE